MKNIILTITIVTTTLYGVVPPPPTPQVSTKAKVPKTIPVSIKSKEKTTTYYDKNGAKFYPNSKILIKFEDNKENITYIEEKYNLSFLFFTWQ
jgi:hypothetical protein